jgi:hypothetical protein
LNERGIAAIRDDRGSAKDGLSLGASFSDQSPVHKSGKVCRSHPDVF